MLETMCDSGRPDVTEAVAEAEVKGPQGREGLEQFVRDISPRTVRLVTVEKSSKLRSAVGSGESESQKISGGQRLQ